MTKHLVSINDLSKKELLAMLSLAQQFKKSPNSDCLAGKVSANCFFEPSTRTRLSFETAAKKLGAQVIGFSDATSTSAQKGECLTDTIQVIAQYADMIILRHPEAGAAKSAAAVSRVPVINAGDGSNEHPTQTLVDLFSILETQGTVEGLKIAIVGDLCYGRTVHSLVQALQQFDNTLYQVPAGELALPESVAVPTLQSLDDVISEVDIVYMTRIQQERLQGEQSDPVVLTKALAGKMKASARILHPLPRRDELPMSIDALKQAYYFQQAGNGVPVRQAVLATLFV